MGNCMEKSSPEVEEDLKKVERGSEGAKMVRIVLTKPELDWLMQQMEQKPVKMSLEALLAQILKERQWKEEERWQPALESIMEVPELQSFENSADKDPLPQPLSLLS
ncbi:uncharacterized protein LOC110022623 [Phalaenopsis equestris]|uniref:uncharacterized protein LOC110022623 n=1 Tax=Phalaenopsis equestris TaxID=78828 RepID=UPI0009E3BB3E|nr:uncharacterized protein LOC110022623 [Phalaenopsis equestris]